MKNFWYSLFKTEASKKLFLLLVIATIIFNFIDAGLSWYLIIHLGVASELNPAMAFLMDYGIGWFFLYKALFVPGALIGLYLTRERVLSKICILLLFFTYTGLMLYFSVNLLSFFILA